MKPTNDLPLLTEVLPTLAAALKPSLIREGEPGLAASIDSLRVHALCSCGDFECMLVYTASRTSPCPGEYRVVLPDAVLTMGVCEDEIWSIEDELLGGTDDPIRFAEIVKLRSLVTERRN